MRCPSEAPASCSGRSLGLPHWLEKALCEAGGVRFAKCDAGYGSPWRGGFGLVDCKYWRGGDFTMQRQMCGNPHHIGLAVFRPDAVGALGDDPRRLLNFRAMSASPLLVTDSFF